MQRKLAAGNWKMNGTVADLSMIDSLNSAHPNPGCEILLCPPAHLLSQAVAQARTGPVRIGAQNCHSADTGAYTGDISAPMLADVGASHVIVGHSERREGYGETDADVKDKAAAAQAAGLTPILCIGESLEQREAGAALDVIRAQLAGSVPGNNTAETLVVAYEPIWAIGTGKIPTMEEIAQVHAVLRADLIDALGTTGATVPLLYGGSVKPGNAAGIFALDHVNGALVGGASLTAQDFSPIIEALSDS
ncbi:triose-phosphate isomerase [Roseobacter denitrificans]|uniref:Triosephosphate isomerase n=1 Tax=Roseobacter denitrificans (strain ATCC 33942 / OCh 114) TaxID=375451 RepID=Q164W2_ROSDO|nr:triose-phosphate isomerase [Roseobacter denitrificans]ABG32481.1 triosephosphate isomerase [Roseobacter denitrificans OCh 114]AVL51938.1 triose-phosphate isomerase [Roseobacter denitrificans]SFF82383.1 triosephosphate isomerase [Roseobacter denitrificans OCh 114]